MVVMCSGSSVESLLLHRPVLLSTTWPSNAKYLHATVKSWCLTLLRIISICSCEPLPILNLVSFLPFNFLLVKIFPTTSGFIYLPFFSRVAPDYLGVSWKRSSSNTHTHTRLTALCPGLPGWAGTRKVKPIWILLEQEIASGSGISWACASLHLAPDR